MLILHIHIIPRIQVFNVLLAEINALVNVNLILPLIPAFPKLIQNIAILRHIIIVQQDVDPLTVIRAVQQ